MSRSAIDWCVYILSNNAHTLYVGYTSDLLRRTAEHRLKLYPTSFTARYTFDRCVYFELVLDEATARQREKQIKGWTRAKKVALIQTDNPYWHDVTPKLQDLLRLK
jgi:putative endonuclease